MKPTLLFYANILVMLIVSTFSMSNLQAQTEGEDSLNVSALNNWTDTTLALNYRNSRFSEVWGFTQSDREYGVIGSTYGVHIIDVTWPDFIFEVDRVPAAVQGYPANHRDYHDYNGYLYGVGDQDDTTLGINCTFQIIDLQYLPDSVSLVYNSDSLIRRSHNIFIDTAKAKLYACAPSHIDDTTSGLEVFSLADPTQPVYLGDFPPSTYIHDLYVRNDTAYLHDPYDNILYVVNFADAANPVILGSLETGQNVTHSGWLTDNGNYYVMADESYGQDLLIADVSDLSDIQIISTINSMVSDSSIAHNPIIKGNYVYIAYYNDGFWVYDISDPYTPEIAGFYDTFLPDQEEDFRGAWGVYPYLPSGNVLISDRQSGLFVLDASAAITDNNANVGISNGTTAPPQNINVYPQPFKQSLHIKLAVPIRAEQKRPAVCLFNNNGQKQVIKAVNVISESQLQINIPSYLPTGIYFLQVNYNGQTYVEKVIKE